MYVRINNLFTTRDITKLSWNAKEHIHEFSTYPRELLGNPCSSASNCAN